MKLLNPNAKVTFFNFFLTETNLWLSLRLVKIWNKKIHFSDNITIKEESLAADSELNGSTANDGATEEEVPAPTAIEQPPPADDDEDSEKEDPEKDDEDLESIFSHDR